MAYKALDENSIGDYIRNRPSMQEKFSPNSHFSIEEVGDGNLNLVFIVRNENDSSETAVLKQALPYLRVAGESWPLTRERVRFETQALRKYNEIAPGLVPEVYDYDEEMSLVILTKRGPPTIMANWFRPNIGISPVAMKPLLNIDSATLPGCCKKQQDMGA